MALLLKEKCQMIQAKLKTCAGCNEPKHIWKSDGKDKYCKECWYKHQPPKCMPKQTKKPNPISVKMKQTVDEYSKLRNLFMVANPSCKAGLVGCTAIATDIHHKAGRGENHLKISTWLPVCRSCHRWIEENPNEAKELGYSENRLN